MAKVFVINEATNERVPFLRGVLVQSLVSAGLSFDDAYRLAQSIRKELDAGDRIGTGELRARIITALERDHGSEQARAFANGSQGDRQTLVITPSSSKPFSVGILTRSLEACAIPHRQALKTARKVQSELRDQGRKEIDHLEMRQIICRSLLGHVSRAAASRYLSWRQFRDSGIPLIILLGGITGTGKSTLATELAFRLNVVRTQSTDMLREIVRGYLAPEEVPALSYSSFEAWRGLALEHPPPGERPADDVLAAGFDAQFGIVRRGLESTISRAVKERLDLIVDGVHVLPSRLELRAAEQEAILVSAMLVIGSREVLSRRLAGRGTEQPGRGASRYLEHLDEIWQLQAHLVELAEEGTVPIIFNWEMADTILQMLSLVSEHVGRQFPVDVDAIR